MMAMVPSASKSFVCSSCTQFRVLNERFFLFSVLHSFEDHLSSLQVRAIKDKGDNSQSGLLPWPQGLKPDIKVRRRRAFLKTCASPR